MSDPAHQLLEEIRDELHQLRLLEAARARVDDGTPLSRAEVCRILHIDMRSTLMPLIKEKLVKTVPWTKDELRVHTYPLPQLLEGAREGHRAHIGELQRRCGPGLLMRIRREDETPARVDVDTGS